MLAQIGLGGSPEKVLLLLAVIIGYLLSVVCELISLALLSVRHPKLRIAAITLAICGGALPIAALVWTGVSFPAMWVLHPTVPVLLLAPALLCILALTIAGLRGRSAEA